MADTRKNQGGGNSIGMSIGKQPKLGYQLEYSAGSHGKKFSATKRRIRFKFGFANEKALRDPSLAGQDCRSVNGEGRSYDEHEVTLVWSIASGKRLILCNGQEMHFSATPSVSFAMSLAAPRLILPEQKFEHSWEMNRGSHCHSITIVAHATSFWKGTPLQQTHNHATSTTDYFRQFDLLVDGRSYFDMPHVFELGVSERGGGMLPARLRAEQQLKFAAVKQPQPSSLSTLPLLCPKPPMPPHPLRRSTSLMDVPGIMTAGSSSKLCTSVTRELCITVTTTSNTCTGEGRDIEIVSTAPILTMSTSSGVQSPTKQTSNRNCSTSTGVCIMHKKDDPDFLFGECIGDVDARAQGTAHASALRKQQALDSSSRSPPGILSAKSWGTDATAESFSPTNSGNGTGVNANGNGINVRLSSPRTSGHFSSPPSPLPRARSSPQYQRRPPLQNSDLHNNLNGTAQDQNISHVHAKEGNACDYDYPAFAALHISSPELQRHRRSKQQGRGYLKTDSNNHHHPGHSLIDRKKHLPVGVDIDNAGSLRVGLC